jgi:hypothetical protein
MLLHPHPEAWVQAAELPIDGDWTDECQGITFGDGHFYFSCNDSAKPGARRAIYRYVGGGNAETVLDLRKKYGNHLGDVDFANGKLFCAMEEPQGVLVVEAASGTVVGYWKLKSELGDGPPPQGDSMPWCAVNPWNKLLYSSEFGSDKPIETVYAYDPANGFKNKKKADLHLAQPTRKVQGGCFSPNGHLYLATDERDPSVSEPNPWYPFSPIYPFGYLGPARVLVELHGDDDKEQELESVCYAPATFKGTPVQIHAVLLDNIYSSARDNIFWKGFSAPVPGAV